jgi:hypothetical protein
MSALRKDVKRGAPKTFQKPDDSRRHPYGERTGFRRYGQDDFDNEQPDRRPPPRPYDYDKRDREPMHVIRDPSRHMARAVSGSPHRRLARDPTGFGLPHEKRPCGRPIRPD